MAGLMFDAERHARSRAALARDLAATAVDTETRLRHLARAALHARSLPGSFNERLLIRG